MTTTFCLNEKELDERFLNHLKSLFKDTKLSVIIEDEIDETEYLLSLEANKKTLEKSIKNIEDGNGLTFSLNKFQEIYRKK